MWIRITLFISCLFLSAVTEAQSFNGVKNWRYIPIDANFWSEVLEKIQTKDVEDLIKNLLANSSSKSEPLNVAERKIALAYICEQVDAGYCSYFYSKYVLDKYPGSMPATLALEILERVLIKYDFDDTEIRRLVNKAAFSEVSENQLSMVNYLIFDDNLRRGLTTWADEVAPKIDPDSYWGKKLEYYQALKNISDGKIDVALNTLENLMISTDKYFRLQQEVTLQIARLYFEKGQFEKADETYLKYTSLDRNSGKALFERAWAHYHMRNYSKALGLLSALKSPFYRASENPERYILEIIIYRDLCRYNAISQSAKEFHQTYKSVIHQLKTRQNLEKNPTLMRMALQGGQVQKRADIIAQLRIEKSLPFIKKTPLADIYDQTERQERQNFEYELSEELKSAANRLLVVNDQMALATYVAGLDKYRFKSAFEGRDYKSEDVDRFAVDMLYWPVQGEYWWEEMSNYRILISDRCNGGRL